MQQIKPIIAALFLVSPFAANAVPVTITIDFDNGDLIAGIVGDFSYSGLNTTGSVGNCPTATGVGPRCAQFNTNTVLTFWLTDGGIFSLVDFYWRSTGQQTNSDQALGWTDEFGTAFGDSFGNLPGTSQGDGDTVYQVVGLEDIATVSFSNNSRSNTRIDNIMFQYDNGLCGDCEPPISVPEPGTLALLGLGLFGMALTRRRKTV